MSAETSQVTDISGGASGTAASAKKAPQAKRVGDAPKNGAASGTSRSAETSTWPTMPTVDVVKFFEDGRQRMREAFEQANGRFDTIRNAARETGDVLQECQVAAMTGYKDLHEQVFDHMQAEIERGYDFLRSATAAKSVSDLMQLQTDYLRDSMETQMDRSKSFAEASYNIFKSTFSPLQASFATMMDKARKST
jgi:hypothetical protein